MYQISSLCGNFQTLFSNDISKILLEAINTTYKEFLFVKVSQGNVFYMFDGLLWPVSSTNKKQVTLSLQDLKHML